MNNILFICMFLLGVVLVLIGVVFALKGKGSEDAGATGSKVISIKGPAWLIVIALGAVLCSGSVWLAQNKTTEDKPVTPMISVTSTTVRPSLHAALDALHVRCEQGEMLSCDDLVDQASKGSDYYKFGIACGGRTNEADYRKMTGTCVEQLGLTG